jgi:hypothetical protein
VSVVDYQPYHFSTVSISATTLFLSYSPMFLSNLLHRTPKTCWVPSGHSAEVMGKVLPAGMVYVGVGTSYGGMTAASGKGAEPALIDIALPVDDENPSQVFRWTPDVKGYFAVGARVKAHYLTWLAGGRQAHDVSTGCLMLFLFGLERRVLFDLKADPEVALELPAIYREVKRLYEQHASRHEVFAGYASEFMAYLRACMKPRPEEGLSVDPEAYHTSPTHPRVLPRELREALGWVAVNGDCVSAELAYAWLIQDPVFTHRSALTHCPQQHKRLFYQRYAEVFRDGLEPDGMYPKISVRYTPASPTFGAGFVAEQFLELPDLPARSEHVTELRAIADYCESRLASFARFAAANPDRPQSLETLCHLPVELWPPRWRRPFENLAEEAGKGRHLPVLTFDQLVTWLPKPLSGVPDIETYRAALQAWGLGIETGERDADAPGNKLVVYPMPLQSVGERPIRGEFELASIAYQLLLFVVKTDNAAPFNEYVAVRDKLELWVELTQSERVRLGAHLAWLVSNPKGMLEGALLPLQNLGTKPKARIVEFLLTVSEAMGVEGLTLARMLARANSKTPVNPTGARQRHHLEPVAVRSPGRKREAFSIPANPELTAAPEPAAPPPRPVIELDMSRIARLKEESAEVGAMLQSIFVETPEPVVVEPPAEPTPTPAAIPGEVLVAAGAAATSEAARVMGLDAKHSRLARQLCEKASWPREEALALCASLGLLLDGALERINEASYDTYDDPLVEEGGDVLEINSEISSEIA